MKPSARFWGIVSIYFVGFFLATCTGTPAYAACSEDKYIKLAYPNDLYVTKGSVNPLYLVDPIKIGTYYPGGKRPTTAPANEGLIWVPKEACNLDKVNLLIAYHGHRSLGYANDPNNANIFLQSSGQKHIETTAKSLIASGKIAPLIIAAPMDDRGPETTVWNKEDYNVNTHISKIKEALQANGIATEFSQVSLIGHSNANCGGGLARAAQELSGKLYLYGAIDGTCGGGAVGNAVFFDKFNVFGTVGSKKAILFHMHQSISDSKATEEIKNSKKGTLDPEGNKSTYTDMWRSDDGMFFSYAFPSNDDKVGHKIAPNIFINEVLPRFFTKDGYDPSKHTAPAGVDSGNPDPMDGASLGKDLQVWNSITGDRQPLTASEIEQMLAKPVPKIIIPGLKFSNAKIEEDSDGSKFILIPFLGEYLAAVYRYAVVAISVIAVVMLIVAGVQWMLPDAGQENINAAKARIQHALIGLLLAVGSYTVLYAVNPELVQFRSLRVNYVKGVPDEDALAFAKSTDTVPSDSQPYDPTLKDCPVSLDNPPTTSLPPISSRKRQEEFVKKIGSYINGATFEERIKQTAEAAAKCKIWYADCGRNSAMLYALAGIGPNSCLIGEPLCNNNHTNGKYVKTEYFAFAPKELKLKLPNYRCERSCDQDLAKAWKLGAYYGKNNRPPGCTDDPKEARQMVRDMLAKESKGWNPEDALNKLQPGDYFTTYEGNDDCTGQHSTIFLGWKSTKTSGIAIVVDGDVKRSIGVRTRDLSKAIITKINRPK